MLIFKFQHRSTIRATYSPQFFFFNNTRGQDVFLRIQFQNKRGNMMYAAAFVDFVVV